MRAGCSKVYRSSLRFAFEPLRTPLPHRPPDGPAGCRPGRGKDERGADPRCLSGSGAMTDADAPRRAGTGEAGTRVRDALADGQGASVGPEREARPGQDVLPVYAVLVDAVSGDRQADHGPGLGRARGYRPRTLPDPCPPRGGGRRGARDHPAMGLPLTGAERLPSGRNQPPRPRRGHQDDPIRLPTCAAPPLAGQTCGLPARAAARGLGAGCGMSHLRRPW